MKVCLLNDSFPPVIDGVANVVTNYADYLMQDFGAEVEVGTPCYPEADYSQYPYKVVPYRSFDTASFFSGYRTGNPFSARDVSELAAFSPDLIHTHCPAASTILARLLREETHAPVIFTYHTKYDVDIKRVLKLKLAAWETIRTMIREIEACDDVWVVSHGAGENLKSLGYEGDYIVMPNGVDFARGRADALAVAAAVRGYDLPEDVPVFLFTGRLMTYKGLPLILDALKMLDDAGTNFRMVFVGGGPDRELLENRATELGIREKCIFTGPIYDREVLRAWNTRANLFLFPSTFDTNGLVVREAAACGLASVLIKDSCAAEGVTDGRSGFTIEETPQALAALLSRLCTDLPHLRDVGETAMEELYLSWKDGVAGAWERYQIVLDDWRSGRLPRKKKEPSDYLVSLAAKNMEILEKGRAELQEKRQQIHEKGQQIRQELKDLIRGESEE